MFSDLLDGIVIEAKSPDGKITCELEDGRDIVMEFASGSYRRYTESDLERELAALAASMWAAHRRAHLMVLSERVGHSVRGDSTRSDLRSREFVKERARIHSEGRSKSSRITVSTNGMTRWKVSLQGRHGSSI